MTPSPGQEKNLDWTVYSELMSKMELKWSEKHCVPTLQVLVPVQIGRDINGL